MGIFGNLFGGEQRTVISQLSQVEAAVGNCVAAFKDRTKLSVVFIFPIMQALAVRLYVQEYGVVAARFPFERIVKALTDEGAPYGRINTRILTTGDSPGGLAPRHRAR
jgi:hypothetical protein